MAPLGASSLAWLWLSKRCSSSARFCSVTLPTLSFSSQFLESLRSLARGPGGLDDRSARHGLAPFENLCVQRERSKGLPLLSIRPELLGSSYKNPYNTRFLKACQGLGASVYGKGRLERTPVLTERWATRGKLW